jgi:perosamine synthetase
MHIPWMIPNYQPQDAEAMKRVMDTGWLTMGPKVELFEKKVTTYLGIDHGVAVNSGTSALDVALKCINLKKSDEVIIPALTYIATANAILSNQGVPLCIDIDNTLNIDPALIEPRITANTKAIMNIDFGGNVSDYHALLKLCRDYDLSLVVDGAQSLGSRYHNQMCCTHGVINTTSFHAAKIITTVEGGMVLTKDKDMAQRARMIRNQGQTERFIHPVLGNNYRMTDINAAMGCTQMSRVKKTLLHRKELVRYYKECLKNVEYPKEHPHTHNSYSLFVILSSMRDKLQMHLEKNGIETRVHYPRPINKQPIHYSEETYPKATEISQKILSLPLYHSMTRDQQDYVIKKVNDFTKENRQ